MINSHGINVEAVERGHCQHVPTAAKVTSQYFVQIVHFVDWRHFAWEDGLGECCLLEVEFVLGVGGVEVDQVEGVVVVAGEDGVAVGGGSDGELVEDAVIFEHFAELALHSFLHHYAAHWLLPIAHVPYLHAQEVSTHQVLPIPRELPRRVARHHLGEKVLLPTPPFALETHCPIA